jgi:branched-chain amino acid transport system permease protein
MVILGGLGRPVGVAVAAILITLLNEWLRDLSQYRMVVYALIIILFMIFRPTQSLTSFLRRIIPGGRKATSA